MCARRSKTKYCPDADCWKPVGARNLPATCAGTAPYDRRMSGVIAPTATTRKKEPQSTQRPRRVILKNGSAFYANSAVSSVSCSLTDGFQHVRRLREDRFLEIGAVGHRHVLRAYALHRRVEVLEQLAADARGQLGAEAAHHLIFVGDHDAVGPLYVH